MTRHRWLLALILALITVMLAACGGQTDAAVTPTAGATVDVSPTPALTPTPTRTPLPPEAEAHTMIPPSAEESALADIRERGAARVGVLFNYPPFGYLAEDGELRGYEVALVRQIGERWGIDIEFVQVTRQTRLPALLAGEVDFVAAAVPHLRELEQMVEFSDTTFRGGYKLMIRAESAADIGSALAIGPVGVMDEDAAAAVVQDAEQRGVEVPVERYGDIDAAVAALQSGEIGSIAARREELMLAAQGSEDVAVLELSLLEEPYAFVVRKGDVPLRDLLSLTVQDMVAEGVIGEIFSTNFYGIPADVFPERAGEPAFTYETFPVEIPQGESVIDRLRNGEPLRVAGLELQPRAGERTGAALERSGDRTAGHSGTGRVRSAGGGRSRPRGRNSLRAVAGGDRCAVAADAPAGAGADPSGRRCRAGHPRPECAAHRCSRTGRREP
jgi:polar amino acid transport system substrate-binding protein